MKLINEVERVFTLPITYFQPTHPIPVISGQKT